MPTQNYLIHIKKIKNKNIKIIFHMPTQNYLIHIKSKKNTNIKRF